MTSPSRKPPAFQPSFRLCARPTTPASRTTRPRTNTGNNRSVPRTARPVAGAASSPAGAGEQPVLRVALRLRNSLESADYGSFDDRVFLAKAGGGRYQMRAVVGRVLARVAWSAAIAQLVEHVIRNDGVTGSNPVCGTSLRANRTGRRF